MIWNTDGSLQQPVYQTDGGVQAVAVSGGSLYAGGHFTNYCTGQLRIRAAPSSATTRCHGESCSRSTSAAATSRPSRRPSTVLAVPRAGLDPTNGALWVGGDFTKVGSTVAAHLAVLR